MWPTAVLLGDSQTQLAWEAGGWAQSLAEKFVRRVDIINRGFSGYNTRMIQTILPEALNQNMLKTAKIVCIFLGSNDASIEDKNPEQAVPVEEFGENLLRIISYLLSNGVAKESLVIVSPPPILPEKWTAALNMRPGPTLPNCKSNELTKVFAKECGEVAKRFNLTFVDLFTYMMDPINKINLNSALSDGLHLGKEGHYALFSLLVPVFNGKLGGSPDALMLPEWRELNNQDTAGSFQDWKSKTRDRV